MRLVLAAVVGLILAALVGVYAMERNRVTQPRPLLIEQQDEPQIVVGERGPKAVRTIPIAPTPTPQPTPEGITTPVAVAADPPRIEHNICTRHHMIKVYIRNGKSWRCRKA